MLTLKQDEPGAWSQLVDQHIVNEYLAAPLHDHLPALVKAFFARRPNRVLVSLSAFMTPGETIGSCERCFHHGTMVQNYKMATKEDDVTLYTHQFWVCVNCKPYWDTAVECHGNHVKN